MLFTPIRKRVYVLWLACILSNQILAYSQVHNLSQYPVPMLLVLMDGQSGSVTDSANTNSNTNTNTGQSSTGNNATQTIKEKVGIPEDPDSPKLSKLKTLILEESQKAGLIRGIVNGVVILYSSLSDLVLYPVLTSVLAIFAIGLILLIVFIIGALKKENFDLMNKLLIFGGFHTILFTNLLFILYEQRKITIKFFHFDKDILLVLSSAIIGYFIGRYFSRQIFEDKALP